MVTHFCVETNRSTERLNLHVSLVSPLPRSYRDAFSDRNWQNAKHDEYHALIKNQIWTLVPRPPDTNIVRCIGLSMGLNRPLELGFSGLHLIIFGLVFVIVTIIRSLHQEFAMIDQGPLNYFLGISVTHDSSGLFLSQKKYAVKILDRPHMVNCNPSRTPIDTESKLRSNSDMVADLTLYQILLEAEYRGVANVVTATCWLRNLLHELHTPLSSAMLFYHDNVSMVYLSFNLVQHEHTKHIRIDIHFVCDLVAAGQV
nr:ribonuclease H-like domain-containing protein [Tanacetum cinerariifolium]